MSAAGFFLIHTWQCTLFCVAAWVMARVLRGNSAALRYRVWLAASLKFLLPFSVLAWIGTQSGLILERLSVSRAAAAMVREVWDPGAGSVSPAMARASLLHADVIVEPLLAVWIVGIATILFLRWRQWQTIRAALRAAVPSADGASSLAPALDVRFGPGRFEPGIIGIRHPILLMPAGIADELSPPQLASIVSHELAHLRRRDNLWASVHALVEVLFWFHPAVWWIERHLVDEREKACDEDVLAAGTDPTTYAQAILSVCRRYMGLPLAPVAGVTGSHLSRRIECIARNEKARALTGWRKTMVGGAVIVALCGPVSLGAIREATTGAPTAPEDVVLPAGHRAPLSVPAAARPVEHALAAGRAQISAAPPQDTSYAGAIAGIVTNTMGQPLERVTVEVTSDDPNAPTETTETDASGAFEVKGLPPGAYTVVFRSEAYTTFKREGLTIKPATEAVVNPVLKGDVYRD